LGLWHLKKDAQGIAIMFMTMIENSHDILHKRGWERGKNEREGSDGRMNGMANHICIISSRTSMK
jgi:hypothetical protein